MRILKIVLILALLISLGGCADTDKGMVLMPGDAFSVGFSVPISTDKYPQEYFPTEVAYAEDCTAPDYEVTITNDIVEIIDEDRLYKWDGEKWVPIISGTHDTLEIDDFFADDKHIESVSYKESGNYIAELEEKVEELEKEIKELSGTIDIGEQILYQYVTTGEWKKTFKPQWFLKVVDTDLSRCLIDGRLRLDLNGEIYWIRLEKEKDWKEDAIRINQKEKVEKRISWYSEYVMSSGKFYGWMYIDILNIKSYKMSTEINKTYKLIGSENIDDFFQHDNRIRFNVQITGENAFERLRALKDKLIENGFKYSCN